MKNLILLAALLPSYSFALTSDLCVSQRQPNSVVIQDTTSDGTLELSKDVQSGSILIKKPIMQAMGGGGGIGTGNRLKAMAISSKFNSYVTDSGATLSSDADVQNVVSQLEDCSATN